MLGSLICCALGSARHFLRVRPVCGRVPLVIGLFARFFHPGRAAAEDHVEYRYEGYSEENDRIQVRTHAIGFDAELGSRITARGLLVYDGLSGATPTGEAPPVGSNDLPMVVIADIRRAASLSLEVRSGRHTTTPGLNYSEESGFQIIDVPARQSYYSADYRLSEFEAFTFGVGAHVKLGERFSVDLACKRYEMRGLDALTPRASYPSANVISLGCAFWF
jgi:hypothetical protein